MKKLSAVLFIGIFIVACNSGKEKETKMMYSDISQDMLKGDISSITETPYKVDSSGKAGEMDSCCVAVGMVDENGNYVKWTESDSKGKVTSVATYERYDNGMWKGASNTKDGKPSGGMQTKIDENNKYILAEELDSTGKVSNYYTDISQNDYAQVMGWKQYDKDSVFRQQGENTFDSSLITSSTIKDSLGNVKNSSTYKYNDKGEQTEASRTNVTKDSTTTKVTTYTYDAHDDMGNWTQRTEYDDKGKPVKIVKRTYEYRKSEK